ncbi:unnamed protein product [Sphagnum balticum]
MITSSRSLVKEERSKENREEAAAPASLPESIFLRPCRQCFFLERHSAMDRNEGSRSGDISREWPRKVCGETVAGVFFRPSAVVGSHIGEGSSLVDMYMPNVGALRMLGGCSMGCLPIMLSVGMP